MKQILTLFLTLIISLTASAQYHDAAVEFAYGNIKTIKDSGQTFSYAEDGHNTKNVEYQSGMKLSATQYAVVRNEKGYIVERYWNDGNPQGSEFKKTYIYNASNQLIREEFYSRNETQGFTRFTMNYFTEYDLNDHGVPAIECFFILDATTNKYYKASESLYVEQKYDEKGNWIYRKQDPLTYKPSGEVLSKRPTKVIERTIEYAEVKTEPIVVEQPKKEDVKPVVVEQPKKEYVKPVVVELPKVEELKPVAVEQPKKEDVKPVVVELPKVEEVKPAVVEQPKKEDANPVVEAAPKPVLVDLGLPSGTKWMSANLGAKTSQDAGAYYSYSSSSDPAKTLGANYHTPTKAEIEELIDKCTWVFTELNADRANDPKNSFARRMHKPCGYTVTGPNGKSIFLPIAGYKSEGQVKGNSRVGIYLVSTVNPDDSSYTYCLSLSSSTFVVGSFCSRNDAHVIRPVSK